VSLYNLRIFFITRDASPFKLYDHMGKTVIIQGDWEVTQLILDTCSICQKINYIEIRKQKKSFIKCCECPPRSAIHAFTLFLVFDGTRWRVPVSRKRFTRRDTVDLFGTGESGNVSLNSFWQVK
jgi:hypothetical protein